MQQTIAIEPDGRLMVWKYARDEEGTRLLQFIKREVLKPLEHNLALLVDLRGIRYMMPEDAALMLFFAGDRYNRFRDIAYVTDPRGYLRIKSQIAVKQLPGSQAVFSSEEAARKFLEQAPARITDGVVSDRPYMPQVQPSFG